VARIGSGDEAPRVPQVIAIPVSPRPVFPGTHHPLTITDKGLIDSLIRLQRTGNPFVGLFLRRSEDEDGKHAETPNISDVITSLDEVHQVGTLASIVQMRYQDDSAQMFVHGHRRIKATDVAQDTQPLQVKVEHLTDPPANLNSDIIKAYSNELVSTLREVVSMNPLLREYLQGFTHRFDMSDPYKLADFAATLTTVTTPEDGARMQEVLEALGLEERLEKALFALRRERELMHVQQQISKQVNEKINENQRKYFLQQQLKQIKTELGMEKDDKEAILQKYRSRLEDQQVPEHAMKVIDEEMEKFESLEKNSSEFNVTRAYLDWLTVLPWSKTTEENFDIERARGVLDEEHYGLKDIKERILEFIAVGSLKGHVHGRILCFVGPPGVGKTSVGKSIAQALNRQFYRFSVGGLSDVSEIKGHRRTYVGAMPGKVIQAMKQVQSSNPLVLIDEIDKLGRGLQGDPASALLELLDPNQNTGFVDHYLDVPVDLSNVLFICTANVLDTIPGPLRDRMEVIRLAGYDLPEKLEIARNYLDKKAREATGLLDAPDRIPSSLRIDDSALEALIRWYCREAGVRNLEKHIEKIYRRCALEVVTSSDDEKNAKDWTVTEEKLSDYVGKPVFTSDRLYDQTPPGVVMGLAWTAMGGSALYIESTSTQKLENPSGSLQVTGQLGDVMKESSRIAHTYAKRTLHGINPASNFFDKADVHVHVPEGATPKDGPSAGITLVTALLSLALDKPVAADLAMTGEVSLTGKVLPVGGIREKIIAARRVGVKQVILPKGNAKDVEELPDYLKDGLDVQLVESYDQVFPVAFGMSAAEVAAQVATAAAAAPTAE